MQQSSIIQQKKLHQSKNQINPFVDQNLPTKQKKLSKITVVFVDVGLNKQAMEKILSIQFPFVIGLSPYTINLESYIKDIKSKGVDVIINIPMETYNNYFEDNGPFALLSKLNNETENSSRLNFIIKKAENLDGYYTSINESFTDNTKNLYFVLKKIQDTRKVIIYNDLKKVKVFNNISTALKINDKVLKADMILDDQQTNGIIKKRLALLSNIAEVNGHAIVLVKPSEINIELIQDWVKRLDKTKFKIVGLK